MRLYCLKEICVSTLLLCFAAFESVCYAAPLPKFTIIDLGTLGGSISVAYGINASGAIAGKSETAEGNMMSFYWDQASGFTDIGLGRALGLNDAGRVVGNYHQHTDDAFIWDVVDGLIFLNKGDFLFATANGISNSGMTVGYARKFNDVAGTKAILWDPTAGTITQIGSLGGPSYAYGINSFGEIVGNSGDPSRAFIWSESEGISDLGAVNEESWQYYARDINENGQVVGYLKTNEDAYKAFIWEKETGIKLLPGDGESLAFAINQHGDIVGSQGTIIGLGGTAYYWKDGQRIDLNQTIPPDSGWELREARDISDSGKICGNGLIDGEIHAFLLTPADATKPDIKANGVDTSITVSATEIVTITLSLDSSSETGLNADWWIAAKTPFAAPTDWYSYVYPAGWSVGINCCIQTPLFPLDSYEVLKGTLASGTYRFYFALDDPDGEATGPWWGIDSVEVNVK